MVKFKYKKCGLVDTLQQYNEKDLEKLQWDLVKPKGKQWLPLVGWIYAWRANKRKEPNVIDSYFVKSIVWHTAWIDLALYGIYEILK